jgi:sugar O-acyltransferase (sialic acid O-acetyltransferase NeuD family)
MRVFEEQIRESLKTFASDIDDQVNITSAELADYWYQKEASEFEKAGAKSFFEKEHKCTPEEFRSKNGPKRFGLELLRSKLPEGRLRGKFKERFAYIYEQITKLGGYNGMIFIVDEFRSWQDRHPQGTPAYAEDEEVLETLAEHLARTVRARLVVDLIRWQFAQQLEVAGFFDDFQKAGTSGPGGKPILGNFDEGFEQLVIDPQYAFVATGTKRSIVRCQLLVRLLEANVPLHSLIPCAALVSPSARIGTSSLLMPGAFVGAEASIGHLFCAHGGVTIEHDARIGHNVMLGPGVSIAGGCTIGDCTFLGAGVTVMPNVTIGSGVLVGTGSVVLHDVPSHVVAYGQPAVAKRDVREGDEVPSAMEMQLLSAEQWKVLHTQRGSSI